MAIQGPEFDLKVPAYLHQRGSDDPAVWAAGYGHAGPRKEIGTLSRLLMATLRGLGFLTAVVVLTLVTQIGGAVLLGAWVLARIWRPRGRRSLATAGLFTALYAAASLWVVPPLAQLGGRVPLPCTLSADAPVRPQNPIYCVLNRHYATPQVGAMLTALAGDLSRRYPGLQVAYLDANFPFIDGFPLLPHRSHDDGRKVDLAFFYAGPAGRPSAAITPSPIGYWGFEQPRPGDPTPCAGDPRTWTLRWDMPWLQHLLPARDLHEGANRAMVLWLANSGTRFGVERLLLEPHLQRRWGVEGGLIRFQGCSAARHDDHLHVQIRAFVGR